MATDETALLPDTHSTPSGPRNKRWSTKIHHVTAAITGIVVLLAGTVFVLRSRRPNVPDEIDHEFGFAFDLTIPYGTAAIGYPNGTIVNAAKIDGSSSCQETMRRLSLSSSEHLAPHIPNPPYNNLPDHFADLPRQLLRQSRKEAGLPSSSDVAALANLLFSLRTAVGTCLKRSISGAIVSIPPLPALYAEDLSDVFEYLGLIYLASYPYWSGNLVPSSGAAFIGNGFGLFADYRNISACNDERHDPPNGKAYEKVLSVSCNRGILTSSFSLLGMYYARKEDEFVVVDTRLGSGSERKGEGYWERIKEAIMLPALEANERVKRGTTDRVIVWGAGIR